MAKNIDILKKNIGKNIQKYRKFAGYTQKYLAVQANLNDLYISQMERGIAIPSIPTLLKIANVLGVEIKVFFEE